MSTDTKLLFVIAGLQFAIFLMLAAPVIARIVLVLWGDHDARAAIGAALAWLMLGAIGVAMMVWATFF